MAKFTTAEIKDSLQPHVRTRCAARGTHISCLATRSMLEGSAFQLRKIEATDFAKFEMGEMAWLSVALVTPWLPTRGAQ